MEAKWHHVSVVFHCWRSCCWVKRCLMLNSYFFFYTGKPAAQCSLNSVELLFSTIIKRLLCYNGMAFCSLCWFFSSLKAKIGVMEYIWWNITFCEGARYCWMMSVLISVMCRLWRHPTFACPLTPLSTVHSSVASLLPYSPLRDNALHMCNDTAKKWFAHLFVKPSETYKAEWAVCSLVAGLMHSPEWLHALVR